MFCIIRRSNTKSGNDQGRRASIPKLRLSRWLLRCSVPMKKGIVEMDRGVSVELARTLITLEGRQDGLRPDHDVLSINGREIQLVLRLESPC